MHVGRRSLVRPARRRALVRAVLVFGIVIAMLTVVGVAGADQSYTDPQGDGKVGTDITNLTVRNDAAGNIQFQVASANPIVANHAIALFVDADHNPATGSSDGSDYWMYGGPATGVGFFAWNGSSFVPASPASFSVGAAASNVTEFRINKSDLNNTSSFTFVAISISIDPPDVNLWDFAPDTGSYSYSLATAPPPTTTTTTTTPPPPAATVRLGAALAKAPGLHAGKAFSVSAAVATTAAAVRVTCSAKVGGVTLHPRGTYAAHRAVCSGTVPAGSVGKRLTGTITATIAGAKATKAFSFVVRR